MNEEQFHLLNSLMVELVKGQIQLKAENQALQRIFVNYIAVNLGHSNLKEVNKKYLEYFQEALKRGIDESDAFSKETTENIYSQLKDIPGLDLTHLK